MQKIRKNIIKNIQITKNSNTISLLKEEEFSLFENLINNMLLNFRIKDYKSFVEDTMFSMTPANNQSGLDYSVLNEKVGKKTTKKAINKTAKTKKK